MFYANYKFVTVSHWSLAVKRLPLTAKPSSCIGLRRFKISVDIDLIFDKYFFTTNKEYSGIWESLYPEREHFVMQNI